MIFVAAYMMWSYLSSFANIIPYVLFGIYDSLPGDFMSSQSNFVFINHVLLLHDKLWSKELAWYVYFNDEAMFDNTTRQMIFDGNIFICLWFLSYIIQNRMGTYVMPHCIWTPDVRAFILSAIYNYIKQTSDWIIVIEIAVKLLSWYFNSKLLNHLWNGSLDP